MAWAAEGDGAEITSPRQGTLFSAGETLILTGEAVVDGEAVRPAQLSWDAWFVRGGDSFKLNGTLVGPLVRLNIPSASPALDSTTTLRIQLTATNDAGVTEVDMLELDAARVLTFIESRPENARVVVDGVVYDGDFVLDTVTGYHHVIEPVPAVCELGVTRAFQLWHDGAVRARPYITTRFDTTLAIRYAAAGPPCFDTTPPVTTINVPEPNESLDIPAVLSGTVADDHLVDKVYVSIQDEVTGLWWAGDHWQEPWAWLDGRLDDFASADTGWSYRFDTVGTPGSGRYLITAWAYDDFGNLNDPTSASVRFDGFGGSAEPAVATFLSPANGSTTAGPARLSGTAADAEGVDAVVVQLTDLSTGLYWDGTGWQQDPVIVDADVADPGASSTTFVYEFDPIAAGGVGPFEATGAVVDGGGSNDPISGGAITFSVDTSGGTGPSVELTTPLDGDEVPVPIDIIGTASDDDGVASVELVFQDLGTGQFWDGAGFADSIARVPATVTPAGGEDVSWTYTLDPSGLGGSGEYYVSIWATDASGLVAADVVSARFTTSSPGGGGDDGGTDGGAGTDGTDDAGSDGTDGTDDGVGSDGTDGTDDDGGTDGTDRTDDDGGTDGTDGTGDDAGADDGAGTDGTDGSDGDGGERCFSSVLIARNIGDGTGADLPGLSTLPWELHPEEPCDVVVEGVASSTRDVWRVRPLIASSAADDGVFTVRLRVLDPGGYVAVGVLDPSTNEALRPLTGVNEIGRGVRLFDEHIRLSTWEFSAGEWTLEFDAGDLEIDPEDLELFFFAVNHTHSVERIGDISIS